MKVDFNNRLFILLKFLCRILNTDADEMSYTRLFITQEKAMIYQEVKVSTCQLPDQDLTMCTLSRHDADEEFYWQFKYPLKNLIYFIKKTCKAY
jgi:hypothetical protein